VVPPAATAPLPPPPKLWEGSFELGINGTEGNSRTLNYRSGAKLKRKTEWDTLSAEVDYRQDRAGSVTTANRAFLDGRYERLLGQSPWTGFLHTLVDYDEFKEYDLRVSLDAGVGYHFLRTDQTTLIARAGGGVTDEIGGPDPRYIPETVLGLEAEHKISKRQKLSASVEYRADVTDFGDYRVHTKAGWEVVLDEEAHLSLKLGVLDRYDNTPSASKPNDLDYSAMLLWSF
jgi:putative salt-induced outer membrane protein YdiY